MSRLLPTEKPHWTPEPVSILEPDQLPRLLDHAGNYRLLFELLAYTGLRIGEALGLTWADIDQDAALIRVHRQLDRNREHAPLKTPAGRRDPPPPAPELRARASARRRAGHVRCRLLGHYPPDPDPAAAQGSRVS